MLTFLCVVLHSKLIDMNATLFDEVLEMPEFAQLDLTIGEYSKLKKQFKNERSVDPIIDVLNAMMRIDSYLISVGCQISQK